ncbi:MAG: ferredoxin [Firmicutes bacterium]|nr:ferredoxin [Bacillota bacterium]
MKANVISDRCIGCGQCEATCPDVFQIGDEGFATVVAENIDENLMEDVEMAASGCPTDAIEFEKEA